MIPSLLPFKKHPYLYYIVDVLLLGGTIPFILLFPKEYIYWNIPGVAGYTVGLFITFALNGCMLAGTEDRSLTRISVEGVLFGLAGGGIPWLFHLVLNRALLINIYDVMNISCLFQFILLGAIQFLITFRSAQYYHLKKTLCEGMTVGLISIMLVLTVLPFSMDFFRTYFRAYSFLSEPCVFVSANDTYAVMFATSGPGTATLTLTIAGEETEYHEMVNGTLRFDRQIHRIDVPKDELERGSYTLSSRQTMDCTGTVYRMGKTITSRAYSFRPYQGNGDLSFLCVSDNQGAATPTQRAVENARNNYNYDFVMLLGDQSEAYNKREEDFISSMLTVAGIASHGEIPVYYTVGNHEYRGMLSGELFSEMPTPSETGEFYYTFTMGDAYFTVLNFTNEDPDDDERYGGVARFSEYKEKEYQWLQERFATKEYEQYRYNVMISHIPVINEDSEEAEEYLCKEIIDLLEENNVQYVVSGHSHVEPQEFTVEERAFRNLHAGSYYKQKMAFRNSIVYLKEGEYGFIVYDSEE